MQNVNLDYIGFLNGRLLIFKFLNSYDGSAYGEIICHNTWKYSEENSFEKGEGFPIFICDVRAVKLKGETIRAAFQYLKYGYDIPECEECYLLCMDSGDVCITLICEAVDVEVYNKT